MQAATGDVNNSNGRGEGPGHGWPRVKSQPGLLFVALARTSEQRPGWDPLQSPLINSAWKVRAVKASNLPYVAVCPDCGAVVYIATPEAVRRDSSTMEEMLRFGLSIERHPQSVAKRHTRNHDAGCKVQQAISE